MISSEFDFKLAFAMKMLHCNNWFTCFYTLRKKVNTYIIIVQILGGTPFIQIFEI